MFDSTIGFKNNFVDVEYEVNDEDLEIINVTYKGVNINEILDDKDMDRLLDELYSVLGDEAEQARIDMFYR